MKILYVIIIATKNLLVNTGEGVFVKITDVKTYFVRPRWGFVEIETDSGITGWGEAVLEGHASAVLSCVQEMEDYLMDKDPSEIEGLWETMYRAGFYRGGGVLMSAISGIDQALWDIKGKVFGVPVYELMGGRCRDKMKVYSWIGGDRPSDVGNAAKQKQAEGFKAIKMNATEELQMIDSYDKIDAVLERVAAIREACGKYFEDEECLVELQEVVIAKKPHVMTEHVAVEATCEHAGNVHYFECSLCEKYYADKEGKNVLEEVVIAAKGHAMTEVEEVKATCGVAGNVHYFECGNCGKYYADKEGKVELTEVIVPALVHSVVFHAAQEAQPGVPGNAAYYGCDNCNKAYADEQGTEEIDINTLFTYAY